MIERLKKNWKLLLSSCVFLGAVSWGYLAWQDRFTFEHVQIENIEVSVQPFDAEQINALKRILNQPFSYLDRGQQSFVFVSHDNQYVLKFFDANCAWSKEVFFRPLPKDLCRQKLNRLINGYKVAYEYDQKHTGLLFLQLKPDPNLNLKVIVKDRLGLKQIIDLAKVPFVIQKKATPTRYLIATFLSNGDLASAKSHFRQIIDMYIDEYQQGLYDRDHNVMYNTGFIGNQPVRIDVGRLKLSKNIHNPKAYRVDLHKIAIDRIGGWTQRHFPKYLDEILADMQAKLQEVDKNLGL